MCAPSNLLGCRRRNLRSHICLADTNVLPAFPYWLLMPAVLITLADSSISARTKFLNSPGVIGIGSAPRFANRSLTSADCSNAATSLLILSTMSGGVPAGANTPTQRL